MFPGYLNFHLSWTSELVRVRETDRQIDRSKELGHKVWGLASPKPIVQTCRLDTQVRADTVSLSLNLLGQWVGSSGRVSLLQS